MLTKLSVNYSMVISLWCEKGCGFFDDNLCFLWFFLLYFKSVSAIDRSFSWEGVSFELSLLQIESRRFDFSGILFEMKRVGHNSITKLHIHKTILMQTKCRKFDSFLLNNSCMSALPKVWRRLTRK